MEQSRQYSVLLIQLPTAEIDEKGQQSACGTAKQKRKQKMVWWKTEKREWTKQARMTSYGNKYSGYAERSTHTYMIGGTCLRIYTLHIYAYTIHRHMTMKGIIAEEAAIIHFIYTVFRCECNIAFHISGGGGRNSTEKYIIHRMKIFGGHSL